MGHSSRDTGSDKNRLVWQAFWFTQYISQLWMSMAGEQIATEALKKSFNLLNCYQEDVECECPNVQAPSPPYSGSMHSIIIYLSLIFNRDHCLFIDQALSISPLQWHIKVNLSFISYTCV